MKLLERFVKRKQLKNKSNKITDVLIIIVLTLVGIHVLATKTVRGIGGVWVEGEIAITVGVCVLVMTFSYFLSIIFNYLKRFERWEKSLLPQIFKGISILSGLTGAIILLLNL